MIAKQSKTMILSVAVALLLSFAPAQAWDCRTSSCSTSCYTTDCCSDCCCSDSCCTAVAKKPVLSSETRRAVDNFINNPDYWSRNDLSDALTYGSSYRYDYTNDADRLGQALAWAVEKGYTDLVQPLLDAGADVNGQNRGGWTALMWACDLGYEDTVRILLANNADLDVRDHQGLTALTWAVCSASVNIAQRLIDAGAHV